MNGDRTTLAAVLSALEELRSPFALYETDIHQYVAKQLEKQNLPFIHEAKLGQGCRIDFLVDGIGIEIKKGKPDSRSLSDQLMRYAAHDSIEALVVLSSRAVSLPTHLLGKPVYLIVLNRLWGVALP